SLQIVVRVVHVGRDQLADAPAKVVERAVLPLVDDERAGRVGAERHGASLRDARVLDRTTKVVGEIDGGEPGRRMHPDGLGCRLHASSLMPRTGAGWRCDRASVAGLWPGGCTRSAIGITNRNRAPTGPFSAQMRPPCASTIERAMARPMPVPPSSRERDWS